MTAFLEIDTLLSRVQLFNHAPDYKSALEMLKAQLQALTMTASNGVSTADVPLSEMVKPSIFDTERMKEVKGTMIDV